MEESTDDLDDVLARAGAAEPAALREVYERLAPPVVGYLRLRGAPDPEGLGQDVFVAVLPRIAQVSGGWPGLRALVFKVAHDRLVDERRRQDRRGVVQEYDPAADGRTSRSAEDLALDRVGASGALGLLDLLPDDQRDVVVLRVLGELSAAEAASVMGRTTVAVKRLHTKALASLRGLAGTDDPQEWG